MRLPLSLPAAFGLLTLLSSLPAAEPGSPAQSPTAPSMSADDLKRMEDRLREMKELFNRLELQAENTKSQIDKARPQPVSFGKGSLTLANSMAWPNFSSYSGVEAMLGFNLDPMPEVKGFLELELLGPVAVDRLLPQQEVKLEVGKQWAVLRKAEVKFENDYMMTRAFRAIPRPDFYEEGDMFYLFPAADDTNKYFRQSGRTTPNGFQFLAKDGLGIAKGFEVWAGDELVYGSTTGEVFARYKQKLGSVDFAVMSFWINDPAYFSGSNMQVAQEAWVRFPLWQGASLDIAADRIPNFIGRNYTVVRTVEPGQGTMGTNALVETKTTTESDAYGVHIRLRGAKDLAFLEEESLVAEYAGPIAGNRIAALAMLSARPQRFTLISIEGGWQKPIVGVNPTVIIGTPGLNLGVLPGTGPRPFGSPVSVYEDPVRNVNNRDMTWITTTLEFNPGQGWFYKYRPRVVEGWNFNSDLKTPFSSALSLRLFNYPGGTDLTSYFSPTGQVVGEPSTASGKSPSNGWLYEVKDITSVGFGSLQTWLELATGQQVSGLSTSSSVVPANTYFSSALSARYKDLTISGGYAEDVYGPDDWYRTFGIVIGNRYRASLDYKFGNSNILIQYEGWRDKDPSKYHNPVNTVVTANGPILVEPPIDQVMTSYTVRF